MKTTFVLMAASLVILTMLPSPGVNQDKTKGADKALEPARFWTMIANDDKLEPWRRGVALFFLYERHVKNGLELGQFAKIVDKPKWIREEDVRIWTKLGGLLPLKETPGDTMFQITVFSKERHDKQSLSIYMNFSGNIDKKTFISIVSKGEKSDLERSKLKGWAFWPKWNDYVKSVPEQPEQP